MDMTIQVLLFHRDDAMKRVRTHPTPSMEGSFPSPPAEGLGWVKSATHVSIPTCCRVVSSRPVLF